MEIRDFTFNAPVAAFFIILVIPIILMQIYLMRYRWKKIGSFTKTSLLSTLLIGRSRLYTLLKMAGWCILWLMACLALMDPIGNLRYRNLEIPTTEEKKPGYRLHEVIFLVDTSASMSTPDGPSGQTRLARAQEIMDNSVRQLKGPTIALYSLTSVLTSVVPPTLDYLFVRLMIKSLHYDEGEVGGTLYKAVLTELIKKEFPYPSNKLYSIVILSDGEDNDIENLKGTERTKAINVITNLFPNPEQYHLRVFTVGIGSTTPQIIPNTRYQGKPVLSALQPDLLQAIAERNRGAYLAAQNEVTWTLSQELVDKITQDPPLEQKEMTQERRVVTARPQDIIYDLYFQIPLALAIIILLMIFILPDARWE